MAPCNGTDTTCWLSFASDRHLGAVLVDGVTFGQAFVLATAAGVNPGGECVGIDVSRDAVPAKYRDAWAALPRLTLLSLDDLRFLGPLANMDGDPR